MNNRMLAAFAAGTVLGFLSASFAAAGDLELQVEGAWVRAMPPSSQETAAFMTLINTGGAPLRLAAASTPAAGAVMPMITTRKRVAGTELLGMEGVDEFVIPAHGRRILAPGGDHLMLMDLKKNLKQGDRILITLRIEPGGKELTVEVPVRMSEKENESSH